MYGWQIKRILDEFAEFIDRELRGHDPFLGVFRASEVPYLIHCLKGGQFAVANTADGYGAHWYLLFRRGKKKHLEIFDPLGFPSGQRADTRRYFRAYKFISNSFPCQSSESALCGQYCVTLAVFLFLLPGESIYRLLPALFSTNLQSNDKFVRNIITILHAYRGERAVQSLLSTLHKLDAPGDTRLARRLNHQYGRVLRG